MLHLKIIAIIVAVSIGRLFKIYSKLPNVLAEVAKEKYKHKTTNELNNTQKKHIGL